MAHVVEAPAFEALTALMVEVCEALTPSANEGGIGRELARISQGCGMSEAASMAAAVDGYQSFRAEKERRHRKTRDNRR